MLLLGLVLVAVGVALGAGIVIENSSPATLTVYGHTVPGLTTEGRVFLAGCVLTAILIAGVLLTSAGMRRIARIRRALRDLSEAHEASITTLELEKRQLQRQLAQTRRGTEEAQVTMPASPFFDSSNA